MTELEPGDRVLYVAHQDCWHETDLFGRALFAFEYVEDGPPVPRDSGLKRARAGDRVNAGFGMGEEAQDTPLGTVESIEDGVIRTTKGYAFRAVGPLTHWPGVVRREPGIPAQPEVLNDEDEVAYPARPAVPACLVLDVQHPNGCMTLHFPVETVPHDPDGTMPHSYHLEGEGV